jgi:hypothetical protein
VYWKQGSLDSLEYFALEGSFDHKQNEAKRKIFGSETKRKYGVFISLWLEAKNSKRNEAKKNKIFSRERAKRISFRIVSLWSEKFLKQNRHTLLATPSKMVY